LEAIFLLDDNVETYDNPLDKHGGPLIVDNPIVKPVANPPKKDILNPKNKVCQPCNREFNRRQAFVEHCRTVHGMKIRFAKAATGATIINSKSFANQTPNSTPQKSTIPSASTTSPSSGGSNSTGYPCQYCGKLFSNQSNRRRHAVLSCELARVAGVEPRKSREDGGKTEKKIASHSQPKFDNYSINSEDFYYEDGAPANRAELKNCPFPECDVSDMRSAVFKRHLAEEHNIQNVSAELTPEMLLNSATKKIKTEPVDMLEIEQNDTANIEESERKVPPLRLNISKVVSQKSPLKPKKEPSPKKDPAKVHTCSFCNEFKSNNLYILGRHQKSCEKKMAGSVKQVENENSNNFDENEVKDENEDDKNDTIDTTAEEHDISETGNDDISGNGNDDSSDDEEGDTTVEVPVDFEATNDEPDENGLDNSDDNEEGDESMIIEPETTLNEQPDDKMEIAQDSNDDNSKQLINNDNSNVNSENEVNEKSNETETQNEPDAGEQNAVQSSEPEVAE